MPGLIPKLAVVAVALVLGCDRTPDSAVALEADDDLALRQGFIPAPDVGGGGSNPAPCNLYTQDCGAGGKCAPYSSDGNPSFDAARCSAVPDEPRAVGESCTVMGAALSGIDDCERGAMCWDADPETGEGTCVALPVGTGYPPLCPNPLDAVDSELGVELCLRQCRPLLSDCPPGQGCYPSGWGLSCLPDNSGDAGNFGDPCFSQEECSAGYVCGGSSQPGCEDGPCCIPVCDMEAPMCPDGTECVPFPSADPLPPGGENLGVCWD